MAAVVLTNTTLRPRPAWADRSILDKSPKPKGKSKVSWDVSVREYSKHEVPRVCNAWDCVAVMGEGCWMSRPTKRSARVCYIKLDAQGETITMKTAGLDLEEAVPIKDIVQVRQGKLAKVFRHKPHHKVDEKLCLDVRLSSGQELVLVAEREVDALCWVHGLRCLMLGVNIDESYARAHLGWLNSGFFAVDTNADGLITREQAVALFARLRPDLSSECVEQKLQVFLDRKVSKESGPLSGASTLTFDEFVPLYYQTSCRQELFFLMSNYVDAERPFFTPPTLLNFLVCEQELLDASPADCEALIRHFEPTDVGKTKLQMGCDGFALMLHQHFPLMRRECRRIYHDLDRPLTSYHIMASHNTYLEQDQIKGPSSLAAYRTALALGARFIEVDVWDGDDEPQVFNGHTTTGRLAFDDVIKTIAQDAFKHSQLPLIVFVENHCSIDNQYRMVLSLTEHFGEMLHVPTDGEPLDPAHVSPSAMIAKVLLMGKRIQAPAASAETWDDMPDIGEVSEDDEAITYEAQKARRRSKGDDIDLVRAAAAPRKLSIIRELSDLFALDSATLPTISADTATHHVRSLDNNGLQKLGEDKGPQLATHCRNHIVRVYPSALRVNSENFDPFVAMTMGAQVISMNMQTDGPLLRSYLAKFRDNGGCGYVLKSRFLASDLHNDFCAMTTVLDRRIARRVAIRVISGLCLPLPAAGARGGIVDPFVHVAISGLSVDTQETSTRAYENNRLNPFWNQTFEFAVACPDEAVLTFAVLDDTKSESNLIGQFGCPLACISAGYRFVPLYTKTGEQTSGSLLVQVLWMDSAQAEKLSSRYQTRRGKASTVRALSRGDGTPGAKAFRTMPALRSRPAALADLRSANTAAAEKPVESQIDELADRLQGLKDEYVGAVRGLFKHTSALSMDEAVCRLADAVSAAAGGHRPLRLRVVRQVLRIEPPEDINRPEINAIAMQFARVSQAIETILTSTEDIEEEIGELLSLFPEERGGDRGVGGVYGRMQVQGLAQELTALLAALEDDMLALKTATLRVDRGALRVQT